MIVPDTYPVLTDVIIDTFSSCASLLVSSLFCRFVTSYFSLFWCFLISRLQDKTNNVIDLYKDILRAVEDLQTCSYTSEAFSELLSKIQAAVREDLYRTLF